MGTTISHRAWGLNARRALRAAASECERLERLLSRFYPGSDIGRLNRSAGIGWETLSPETLTILAQAAQMNSLSGGAFDVTVGPLCALWNFRNAAEPPEEDKIQQVLPLVDGGGLQLDPDMGRARLKKPGQSVDLGGIAKGYAADRFIEIFKEHHCKSAFTNIGGNVSLFGNKPDGRPWSVGIRHPREKGRLLGAIQASGCSVVTSGDYERCFTGRDGRLYHHLLNPATGWPADAGLVSVTVAAESAALADALSTAVFVLGPEKGMMLLRKYEGAGAVLVDKNLTVSVSGRFAEQFKAAEGIAFTVLS